MCVSLTRAATTVHLVPTVIPLYDAKTMTVSWPYSRWVRVRGRFKNNSEKVTRDMLNKWNFMKHLWRRRLRKEMKKQRSMCQRHSFGGCILVYRYTKEGNINELRHNSMYGYENNRNSLVYRYTRTAPFWGWDEWRECSMVEIDSDHQNLFF